MGVYRTVLLMRKMKELEEAHSDLSLTEVTYIVKSSKILPYQTYFHYGELPSF